MMFYIHFAGHSTSDIVIPIVQESWHSNILKTDLD